MKTMTGATIAALAFGLGLASTPVFAADYPGRDRGQDATQQQDQDKKGDENNDRRGKRDAKPPAPTPGANDNQRNGRQNMDFKPGGNKDNDNDRDRARSNRTNTDFDNNNRDRNRDGADRNRNDNNRFDNNRSNDRDWNRNSRNRNININIYRRNITSPRRYRHGTYHAPRGYNYRRWHYGERLPAAYYGRDYWLLDFIAFGLFAPPPGFVWVRYGDDALLIDTYTGEIVQVRYDVFYS